jgi:hypothetical protein
MEMRKYVAGCWLLASGVPSASSSSSSSGVRSQTSIGARGDRERILKTGKESGKREEESGRQECIKALKDISSVKFGVFPDFLPPEMHRRAENAEVRCVMHVCQSRKRASARLYSLRTRQ